MPSIHVNLYMYVLDKNVHETSSMCVDLYAYVRMHMGRTMARASIRR